MSSSPFDHPLLSDLLGDDEILPFLSAEAEIAEIVRFEAALAVAEGAEGVIPSDAAEHIVEQLKEFSPDLDGIRHATARDGTIGVEFVRQLREWLGPPFDLQVHFGSTSQDLVDTALVQRLRPILAILRGRVETVVAALHALDAKFGTRQIMARTRMQDAVAITVSAKLATWHGPLHRDLARLDELLPRLLVLQFGGAAGTLDKLGGKATRRQSAAGRGARSRRTRSFLAQPARQHRRARRLAVAGQRQPRQDRRRYRVDGAEPRRRN